MMIETTVMQYGHGPVRAKTITGIKCPKTLCKKVALFSCPGIQSS